VTTPDGEDIVYAVCARARTCSDALKIQQVYLVQSCSRKQVFGGGRLLAPAAAVPSACAGVFYLTLNLTLCTAGRGGP